MYMYIETETYIKYEKSNFNVTYIIISCIQQGSEPELAKPNQLLPASVPHSPCTGIDVSLVNLALHGTAELALKPRPGIYPNGFCFKVKCLHISL